MSGARRVLFVVGELTAGGYQTQLQLLLSELDRSIIEPHLAVWRFDANDRSVSAFRDLPVPIHALKRRGGRIGRILALARIARAVRPDYLHSYSFYTNFPTWCAARACKASGAVGSFRSNYHDEIHAAGVAGQLSARLPRVAMVNSRAAMEAALVRGRIAGTARMFFVPNAVDVSRFAPREHDRRAGALRLVAAGRLTRLKRWDWLFERLARVKAAVPEVEWQLTLYGEGEDEARLVSSLRELELVDRVRMAGFHGALEECFAEADLLLHSSAFEGTPNVIAEAASCGLPVLTTRVGDVSELVRDGETGFVVEVDDTEGFESQLVILLRDAARRRVMGAAGRAWMVSSRSPQRLVQSTLNAYREIGWKLP